MLKPSYQLSGVNSMQNLHNSQNNNIGNFGGNVNKSNQMKGIREGFGKGSRVKYEELNYKMSN